MAVKFLEFLLKLMAIATLHVVLHALLANKWVTEAFDGLGEIAKMGLFLRGIISLQAGKFIN